MTENIIPKQYKTHPNTWTRTFSDKEYLPMTISVVSLDGKTISRVEIATKLVGKVVVGYYNNETELRCIGLL